MQPPSQYGRRPSAAGSTRKKVTCEEFRAEVESSTKAVGMPLRDHDRIDVDSP
jgi:hypothetical protein